MNRESWDGLRLPGFHKHKPAFSSSPPSSRTLSCLTHCTQFLRIDEIHGQGVQLTDGSPVGRAAVRHCDEGFKGACTRRVLRAGSGAPGRSGSCLGCSTVSVGEKQTNKNTHTERKHRQTLIEAIKTFYSRLVRWEDGCLSIELGSILEYDRKKKKHRNLQPKRLVGIS